MFGELTDGFGVAWMVTVLQASTELSAGDLRPAGGPRQEGT